MYTNSEGTEGWAGAGRQKVKVLVREEIKA